MRTEDALVALLIMEANCCVDVLTGAAHHHNAQAYGEDMEDEYSEEEGDHGEGCCCDDCVDLRMQHNDFFYDADDPYIYGAI